jgi:hypothetical protein
MNNLDLNKKLLNLMESAMMEKAKPDYIDLDKDGDKEETMKKAAKDKKKMDEAEDKDGKMPSKAEVMKCCKDGMSVSEICKKYSDCDQDKLKEMCKDCMEERKEKTDESITTLSDSLKQKLSAVMETSEEVAEASAEELDEEEELNEEPVAEQDEVTEDESLDEMAELLKMAGLDEGTASCSSMPKKSMPTTGPEQVNGYEGDFVGEETEAEMDDHAEKAGEEVAHDMEYDDHHDAHDDDHDEKEGDKVTKEIEFDDKEHEAMKSLLKKLLEK